MSHSYAPSSTNVSAPTDVHDNGNNYAHDNGNTYAHDNGNNYSTTNVHDNGNNYSTNAYNVSADPAIYEKVHQDDTKMFGDVLNGLMNFLSTMMGGGMGVGLSGLGGADKFMGSTSGQINRFGSSYASL